MPVKLFVSRRLNAITQVLALSIAAIGSAAQAQQPERQVFYGQDTLSAVVFSNDAKKIAFVGKDKMLHVINPQTQQQLVWTQTPIHNDIITSAAFSPDGKEIATASSDKTVKIWDASNNNPNQPNFQPKEKLTLKGEKGHTDVVMCVIYSHDGKYIATGSLDKTIKIWDAKTGELKTTIANADDKGVITIAFSNDDKFIAAGGIDKAIRLFDAESGEQKWKTERQHSHLEWVFCLTFSHDGKTLASASQDATVKLLDPGTGAEIGSLKTGGHKDSCNAVAFSSNDKTIYTCGDGVIKIWDAGKAEVTATLKPSNGAGELWSLSVSSDGKWIAAGGEDHIGRIWDLPK